MQATVMDYLKRNIKLFLLILFQLLNTILFAQPTANFNVDKITGCSPMLVKFTNLSSSDATSYSWDFGNGNSPSTEKNPSVLYTQPGIYTISLMASNAFGSDNKSINITVYASSVAGLKANKTSLCGFSPIQFTDLSVPQSATITKWLWSFGDGQFSSVQHPTHTYATEGNFSIYLLTEDANGCTDTYVFQDYISVNQPKADFTMLDSYVCTLPASIQFTNKSTGIALNYTWKFGDGNSSTVKNPQHTYNKYDTAMVKLIVNSNGTTCSDSIEKLIRITNYKADFSYTASCAAEDFTLNFTNTSNPVGTINKWNFGDAASSKLPNPSHTYYSLGKYTITLISQYNSTCIDTVSKDYESPKALFAYSPLPCKAPFDVNFINQSMGTNVSFSWTFSNGNTSTLTNPSQTFTVPPMQHIAHLVATNPWGCNSKDSIYLYFPIPMAVFIDTPFIGCAPLNVEFTNKSYLYNSPIASIKWDFGDPSSNSNTSNLENPSHIYNNAGEYDVKLVIENVLGCKDSITMSKAVKTGVKPANADFILDADTICHHSIHSFIDTTQYSNPSTHANYWCWTFYGGNSDLLGPDGTLPSSCPDSGLSDFIKDWVSVKNPYHDFGKWMPHKITVTGDTLWLHDPYPVTGIFYVHMIVGNNGCYQEVKKPIYIQKNMSMPSYVFLNGNFGNGSCSSPFSIGLFNGSSNWDLLNYFNVVNRQTNDTVAKINASDTVFLQLNKAGNYDINISTTNNTEHCVDIRKRTITIDSVIPRKTIPDTACVNTKVRFVNGSKSFYGNMIGALWDFGDNSPITGIDYFDTVYHVYKDTGTYIIKLTVKYEVPYTYGANTIPEYKACEIEMLDTIRIEGIYSQFSVSKDTACLDESLQFTDLSGATSPLSRVWDFGDNTTSSLANPQHNYLSAGIYTVDLLLQTPFGCKDTLIKDSLVFIPEIVSQFIANDTIGCIGDTVKFINQSEPENLTFLWDFSQGDTSSVIHPSIIYGTSGIFNITLYASDIHGCKDTLTKTNFIDISNFPIAAFRADTVFANCPPLIVSFTDSSYTNIQSWLWNFGDNLPSTNQNPVHHYIYPGKYDVTLTVINKNQCSDTITKSQYIIVKGPYGSYILNPDTACVPFNVLFDFDFTNTHYYIWDYGNGVVESFHSSIKQDSVYHSYTDKGVFFPKVELLDSSNCYTVLGGEPIYAEEVNANFSASDTLLCSLNNILLTNLSTAKFDLSYYWNFGDNNSAIVQNPVHSFINQGMYNVTLISRSSIGCSDTVVKSIAVYKSPALLLDTLNQSFCIPLQIKLQASNGDTSVHINHWTWKYNNIQQDSSLAAFTVNNTGTQNFTLTVTYGDNLCHIDSMIPLITYDAPVANFNYDSEHPSIYSTVFFTDNSDNTTAWLWNFDDIGTSTKPNPAYNFNKKGEHSVTLVAFNQGNCSDTIRKNIYVSPEDFVKISSGFSPNGDGVNDYLRILNAGEVKLIELIIYNRWGQLVFQTTDIEQSWNGTYNGNMQNEGTYAYYIKAINIKTGKEIFQKGNITLIK